MQFKQKLLANAAILMEQLAISENKEQMINPDHFHMYLTHLEVLNANNDGMVNDLHPCVFAASENHKNMLHYGEMVKASDRNKFKDAMEKEVSQT